VNQLAVSCSSAYLKSALGYFFCFYSTGKVMQVRLVTLPLVSLLRHCSLFFIC